MFEVPKFSANSHRLEYNFCTLIEITQFLFELYRNQNNKAVFIPSRITITKYCTDTFDVIARGGIEIQTTAHIKEWC